MEKPGAGSARSGHGEEDKMAEKVEVITPAVTMTVHLETKPGGIVRFNDFANGFQTGIRFARLFYKRFGRLATLEMDRVLNTSDEAAKA